MDCSCTRTHLPESFVPMPEIPFCTYRKYRPEYYEVKTLLNLCSRICNSGSEPTYWNFTPDEVADWILEDTDHPEYREVFIKNNLCGKSIIFLEADKFPRINIKIFEVIKHFTAKIRKLCGTDEEEYNRSISLPIRKPYTLYLWYKTKRTGPSSYYMTPEKYFRVIHIIPEEQACGRSYYALLNHWNRIPPYMPWCPHIMIGGSRRINPMTGTTQRQNFHPKDHPYLLKEHALCMYHLPPDFKFPVGKEMQSKVPVKKASSIAVTCVTPE